LNYRVIKENDLFLMTDKNGNIPAGNTEGYGLYTKDTRFISELNIAINGKEPLMLSSSADENYISTIRLTNPHMEENGELILWRESIEIVRTRFIYEGALYETFKLTSYFPKPVEFDFSVLLNADFVDMFIVRGFQYGEIGAITGEHKDKQQRVISYKGADGVIRETHMNWDKPESSIDESGAVHFQLKLSHQQSEEMVFFIAPVIDGNKPVQYDPAEAKAKLSASYAEWYATSTSIQSDMSLFDNMFNRGVQDLRVLLTDLGYGRFPVAGLPWYSVAFGRDSLIAALQMLPLNPEVARGTLKTLAAYQGKNEDEWRDETPGKIMHEIRYGELAGTNQVPFTPYYGTIDATPLFIMLAAEYYHWTGDAAFITELMPNLEAALEWINKYGDRDGDQFVEYYQQSSKGIANQGWKDSADSVVHADGSYAQAPIALAEVQGYVYQAKTRLAPIYRALGKAEQADRMEQEAAQLKERFEEAFWLENEQFYAIALDGDKRKVESVTSNPGHVLMSGITSQERAAKVAQRLVADDMFSGYGIRTMSTQAAGYNPMSYHDGSIWPHDNSMCLLGLSQLGFQQETQKVIGGLLKAAEKFEYYRLPELYCGYDDSIGYPVSYPVACSPQAWAAGTPITFVQALLGIRPDAFTKQLSLHPTLLDGMNELLVQDMKVGEGTCSVRLSRDGEGKVQLEVLSNTTGYTLQVN